MPETLALVRRLRGVGHAAVVSGAGPSVLVLTNAESAPSVTDLGPDEWQTLVLKIDTDGARTT